MEANFPGPTLVEVHPMLTENSTAEVRWEGTAMERALLETVSGNITLVVPTLAAMERAATVVGTGYNFPEATLDEGMRLFTEKESAMEWRKFCSRQGSNSVRGVVTSLVAAGVREGRRPKAFPLVRDCWLRGTNPADLGVLFAMTK